MDNRLHPLRASQRLLTYLVCGLIAWQPLLPAISATINPVTSGTNMDKAANGVPVVNIATPNGAGISHNQFKDYNVGKEGLILNNATGQLNKTQLGGYIQNNPNLTAGREAKGIINEVTGGSRSQLQGYTEVAGKAANVIVANPYGITCSGCGFINTPNATLTTGKPVFDAKGNLQSLDVSKGTITVEGQGLDASQSDALSIISRATEVNAAIHAKDLKVVAGANRVGSDGSVTAIAGEGAAPVVAVDTGALGGMYANRIHLVSGEKGVGVNLGNLNARQGDITLDANGKLVLNNSLSSGALTVKADSAELGGDNKASGAATVTAHNGIALKGGSLVSDKTVALDGGKHVQLSGAKVTAGEDISLAGAELNIDKNSTADAAGDIGLTAQRSAASQNARADNSSQNAQSDAADAAITTAQGDVSDAAGQTAGKLNNAGQLTAGKGLTLQADRADNSGSLVAKGTLSAKAKQLTNSGKLVGDTLETDSETLDNRGEMLAGQKLKITTNNLSQGGTISAKGSADISARDRLENKTGGSISSDNGLTLRTTQLTNNGTLSAAQLGLESDAITNSGLMQGTQSLSLLSNSLDNQKSGSIATAGDLALDLPDFTNSGLLSSGGALSLSGDRLTNSGEINAASLTSDNTTLNNLADGRLLAKGAMQLTNAQLDNAWQIAADGLDISAGTLTNSGGIQGTNGLTLKADTLTNRNNGELLTGGKLTLNSGELANDGLLQGGTLDVTADNWRNGGNALSAQDATVKVRDNLTNSGKILGQQGLDVEAATTDNSGWLAGLVLTLHGDLVNSGLLQGTDGLTLQGSTLTSNSSGQILTSGQATVTADTLDNSGTMQADTLTLDAQTLTNRGQWTANNLTLKGGSLENDGAVNAISSLTAQLTGKLTQQQDKTLQSGGLLKLSAAELDNGGRLQGGTVQLDGGTLTNSGWLQATDLILNVAKAGNTGTLLAEQQATLTGDTLTNSGTLQVSTLAADYQQLTNSGTMLGSGDVRVAGGQITQQAAGKLFSGGNLALTSSGFDQLGQVVALGSTTFRLADSLTSGGTIAAGKTLDITSGGTLTSNGVMQGETVALKATGALNNGGQITGGSGALTLNGGSITSSGSVQGGGDMTFTSNGDIALSGFTGAGGTLTLNAPGAILNTALLYAANNLYLLADKIQNQGGDILAGNSLWMQRDAAGNANTEIVNSSGTIETQKGDITIKTGHLLNRREGLAVIETREEVSSISGMGNATLSIPLSAMPEASYGYYTTISEREVGTSCGGREGNCSIQRTTNYHYAPYKEYVTRKLAYTQRQVDVTSNGGAARIASGRNLTIHAGNLDNQASSILANNVINISGNQLNNQSWQAGTEIDYLVYQYGNGTTYAVPLTGWLGQQQQMDSLPGNPRKIINYNFVERQSEFTPGTLYRSVIQAGDAVTANFTNDIGNTTTTAFGGRVSTTLTTPSLAAVSSQNIAGGLQAISLGETPAQDIGENLYSGVQTLEALREQLQSQQKQSVDISAYPLPASNDGYFVTSSDPASPYLITMNPKLDGVGKLDPALYGDLYALLGQQPGAAPQETRSEYTDRTQFLGSSYLLGRLNLNPEYDYRFLGDAAFDTRYVSNAVLNQTGNRYVNGIGSELEQMRYLMDNAANAQNSLGLQFGVSLSADQVAALTQSIIWWETATINGETVLVPKLYLAASDTKVNQGSIIAGDNIQLAAGSLTNDGSTLNAAKALTADSQDSIRNLNSGTITAQDKLQLSALKDIDNISSDISGGHVALQSQTGNINNITDASLSQLGKNRFGSYNVTDTFLGHQASITSTDSLTLEAGKDIRLKGAALQSGGDLVMTAGGDIDVSANQLQEGRNVTGTLFSGFLRVKEAVTDSTQSTGYQKSSVTSGGNLVIDAGNDLAVSASNISAQQAAALRAGGNLSVAAEQTSDSSQQLKSRNFRPEATRSSLTGVESASVSAGSDVSLLAGNNLSVNASNVNAGKTASLSAGNDLSLDAQATSKTSSRGGSESHSSGVAQTTLTSGENLTLTAGRDLNSTAAAMAAEGDAVLQAGRDVNLQAAATSKGSSWRAGSNSEIREAVRQQSTEVISGGDVAIQAGHDLNSNATQVVAQQDIAVAAGNNVNLDTATESDYYYKKEVKKSGGFLSKKTTTTIQEDTATREKGTLLSGNNVSVEAGKNILVNGSQVVGDEEVALKAGDNIDILAATNTSSSWRFSETKKSGLMGTGGIGVSIGSSKTTHDLKQKGTTQSQSVSTVGSTGGNVSIASGGQVHLNGSDLVAGKGITVESDNVLVTAGHDKHITDEVFKQQTSGLTLALSGAVGSAINSAVAAAQTASEQSDGRLAALQGAKAALSGVQASQAARLNDAQGNSAASSVGIMLSLGAQSSKSQTHSEQDITRSSTLNAGNNLTLKATGKGETASSGDINVEGGQLKAGNDVTLDAARDITLAAAKDTQKLEGSNSSKGGSIGIGLTAGSGGTGLTVSASMNASKGNEKGNGTSWNETNIDAGNQVSLISGRDTTLSGALVNGDKVVADVGRDLTLTSLQDSNNYDSKQQSMSAGVSFTWGVPGASASFSYSKDKMHSTYDSVQEQSGIYAGNGGFDITVGSHTQLNGAVIASNADAAKNSLDTGTLGFSDIQNEADYKVEHVGVGLSTGGGIGSQFAGNMASTLLAGAGGSGHAEGTTQSAVADGTITVRDQANQKQDVAGLSRDTANANGAINQIFDKEKEQKRLQTAQMIGEIGAQVADIARTEGQIEATQKAKASMATATDADRSAAIKKLQDAKADVTDKAIEQQMYDTFYNQAFTASEFGTGGSVQRAITAATAVVQGLAGGDMAAAIAGGAAPFITNEIAKLIPETNTEGRALAHAAVNAALAAVQGKDMAVAAAGAATGELVGKIAKDAYGKDVSQLSETDKQTVSALATLASALAGGLIGGSGADSLAAGQTGKTVVENNALTGVEGMGTGFTNYGQAQTTLQTNTNLIDGNGSILNPASEEQIRYASDKLLTGELPAGQNAATGLITAWGAGMSSIFAPALLPSSVTAGSIFGASAIGGAANVYNQLTGPDSFSATDALIATGVSGVTQGRGPLFTEVISVVGAYGGAVLQNKDPLPVVAGATIGTAVGMIGGKTIEVGNKYYPVVTDKKAEIVGSAGGSIASEIVGSRVENALKGEEGNK